MMLGVLVQSQRGAWDCISFSNCAEKYEVSILTRFQMVIHFIVAKKNVVIQMAE